MFLGGTTSPDDVRVRRRFRPTFHRMTPDGLKTYSFVLFILLLKKKKNIKKVRYVVVLLFPNPFSRIKSYFWGGLFLPGDVRA